MTSDPVPQHGIGSTEGMSIDQLMRMRLGFAVAQNAAIVQQTVLADAKAATLIALTGALALPTMGAARDGHWPSLVATALAALVIVLCLLVLAPRMADANARADLHKRDRYSWTALIGPHYGEAEHADFLRASQASDLVAAMARSNVAAALIVQRKYHWLRVALALAIADLVAFVATRLV